MADWIRMGIAFIIPKQNLAIWFVRDFRGLNKQISKNLFLSTKTKQFHKNLNSSLVHLPLTWTEVTMSSDHISIHAKIWNNCFQWGNTHTPTYVYQWVLRLPRSSTLHAKCQSWWLPVSREFSEHKLMTSLSQGKPGWSPHEIETSANYAQVCRIQGKCWIQGKFKK